MAEINDFTVADGGNTARWPEGMALSAVNDAGRATEGILGRWYQDIRGIATVTGSAGAYVLTTNRSIAALYNGLDITFRPNHVNPGASTLAVNGLTATPIKVVGDQDTESGDFKIGQIFKLQYDGTNFQVLNFSRGGIAVDDPNVFTATQTFQSSDAGAAAGPLLALDRNSASPAANDFLAVLEYLGRNNNVTPETIRYASMLAQIVDATDGSEDARMILRAFIGGVDTDIATFGPGVQIGAPTGGDQGAGTMNVANGYFENGDRVAQAGAGGSVSASGSAVTLFTGAADVNVIDIALDDVSGTTADAELGFQLGDAGGFETTSYTSTSAGSLGGANRTNSSTNRFQFADTDLNSAASFWTGGARIFRLSGNVWAYHAYCVDSNGASSFLGSSLMSSGVKTLSEPLTQLRASCSPGTFDNGTFHYRYR